MRLDFLGGSAGLGGAGAGAGEDGEEGQDLEVGPNGGAKHWTEEEKTRFFTWMLTSDEHWDAFKTRMNTVFREVRRVRCWREGESTSGKLMLSAKMG